MDLFSRAGQERLKTAAPLAARMRPRTLDEYAGQTHIIGPGRLLRRAIQADQLSSLIFYGPPGTGKTTLAMVIANSTRSHFITINAVLSGVKEIREAIATAQERLDLYGQRTTLFVDEVHRWNKAQQDALLPHVENGTIILVGATTENPYFEVNKALVSRSRIFQLRPLTEDDLRMIARQALADEERGYGALNVELADEALDHLVDVANGDARGVLNALELAVETTPPDDDGLITITLDVAEESIQRRAVLYDKDGDVHYDTISAFIKSLRGSDPDAALYWMAKMIYAGEDPRFVFRRMAIFAGEDVGMADPQAMSIVNSCWETFERIGMPEGRFPLALAAIYLATAPKSNTTFAFFDALGSVEKEAEADVPTHLKDGTRDKEGFGHGEGYLYPHAYRDHWVAQQYLPDALQGKVFYQPGEIGYEAQIKAEVDRRREAQLAAMLEAGDEGHGEVLTTSPANRARDAWLQRTIAGSGRALSHVRDHIFALAALQRHHLVLDANAGSGLLTWEAVRQVPEGGVWSLAADPDAGEALRQQAGRLPEVEQPVILIGTPPELEFMLALRDEEELRLDRILGRNLLSLGEGLAANTEMLVGLVARLLPGGRLVLAQPVPRHTQRLAELVDWGSDKALGERVRVAEEAIYTNPNDPLVSWDGDDLAALLAAVGLSGVRVNLERRADERRLTEEQLDRWFAAERGDDGRPTYAEHLRSAGLSDEEVEAVAARYRRQLAGQSVPWASTMAYAVAEKA